jgi:hypothetical protein
MLILAGVCTEELKPIVGFFKAIIQIIQILIPIGLILYGTIDLGKAVIANDEKEIKENQKLLLKRAISAVVVFLVATIVTFVIGFVGGKEWQDCWRSTNQCTNGYDPISGGCK